MKIYRELKMNYYRFLIWKNHLIWWVLDNPIEIFHRFIEILDDILWKIGGFE